MLETGFSKTSDWKNVLYLAGVGEGWGRLPPNPLSNTSMIVITLECPWVSIIFILQILKALFNKVSTLTNSELHCCTCYQYLWYGVKMKHWKWHFKSISKCFKEVEIFKWFSFLPHWFSPIDCGARIIHGIRGGPKRMQRFWSVISTTFLIEYH